MQFLLTGSQTYLNRIPLTFEIDKMDWGQMCRYKTCGVITEATKETVEKLISGCRNLPGKVWLILEKGLLESSSSLKPSSFVAWRLKSNGKEASEMKVDDFWLEVIYLYFTICHYLVTVGEFGKQESNWIKLDMRIVHVN